MGSFLSFDHFLSRYPHVRSQSSWFWIGMLILIMGFTVHKETATHTNLYEISYHSNSSSSLTRIHVDSAATAGLNDGTSWTNAFTSLSVALDSARSCGIDTILVGSGTYIPTDSLGVVPDRVQRVTFTMSADMVMLGGFSPLNGVTEIDDRDWMMYQTILSGDLMQDDSTFYNDIIELDDRPERDSNAYHIITQLEIQTTENALIDGFYLIGGNANADFQGDEPEFGGAIYLENSTLTISNCEFSFNAADQSAGAIFHESGGDLTILNCNFHHNWSDFNGGAISSEGNVFTIENSIFESNKAEFGGGGISAQDSAVSIARTIFNNNESFFFGGGLALVSNIGTGEFAVQVTSCSFMNNSSVAGGGLIFFAPEIGDEAIIDSCLFQGNFADDAGGGVVIFGDKAKISNSEFYENLAFAGGGIHAGITESFLDFGDLKKKEVAKNFPVGPDLLLEIDDCIFQRDTAEFGGAIASFMHQIKMNQSIIQGNFAFEFGGGIEALNSIYTGANNLWSGNYANSGGGAFSTEYYEDGDIFSPQFHQQGDNQKSIRHDKDHRRSFGHKNQKAEFDFNQVGTTHITNSTFTSNLTDGLGGAFNLLDTEDTLTNVIIYDNEDETGVNTDSAGIFIEVFMPRTGRTGQSVLVNCVVQGSNGSGSGWSINNGIDGGGNIDIDPQFVMPISPSLAAHTDGNFELLCGSPAIDAGTVDTTSLNIGSEDLNGSLRVISGIVDMGAYEFGKGGPNGNIVYVDSSATSGGNNGLTWDDAFLELYDALNYACLEPGDTIFVARGTYFPDVIGHSDPRDATFTLRDSIVLLGGFAPDIGVDSSDERDWDMYQSIASGDIGIRGDSTDNAYSVISADFRNGSQEITSATIVDGFYIQDGVANKSGSVSTGVLGGGMFCWQTNPTLRNLTFRNNLATSAGGGLYTILRDFVIDNCHFVNNTAFRTPTSNGSGGGAVITDGRLIMTNSSFVGNQAESAAGLQLTYLNSVATDTSLIYNCLFKDNLASNSSGALSFDRAPVKVVQSEIVNNNTLSGPGAFLSINSPTQLINSLLYGNKGSNGNSDVVINIAGMPDSSLNLINSIFWNNGARESSNRIASGNGAPLGDEITIQNCILEFGLDGMGALKSGFGIDLGGNLDAYPEFIDTMNCNFRLGCPSPGINAGTQDTFGLCLRALDFNHSLRIAGKSIDIGPHEVQDECIAIEVFDVAYGEVCDTSTQTALIINAGVDNLIIDTIISSSTLFTYDESSISFPLIIPNCDTAEISIDYNPVVSGNHSGTLSITSNAVNIDPAIINMSGSLDTTMPIVTCLDTTIYLDANGMFAIDTSYILDVLSDNCGIDTVFISQSDFNCNHVGSSNSVILTVRDIFGNTNTCTSIITVRDTIPPMAICQDLTVYLDADGLASITATQIDNGSSDACGIKSLSINSSNFACTDVGMNAITLTVVDGSDNVSTCSASVTVLDTIPPVVVCQDLTVYLDASGMASVVASDIDNGSSDSCGIQSMILEPTRFDCNDIGANEAGLLVIDNNSNIASCDVTITVLDTISPTALCQDVTIYLDATGMASISADDINNGSSDVCGIQSVTIDSSNFDCTEVGMNDVVLTVTDSNDNVSTCIAQVTVLDTISPIAVCQNITVYLDASGIATISPSEVDNGSSDACGIQSLTIDSSNFDCSKVGLNMVALTVTDNNDNVSTCMSEVTVLDTIPQETVCQDITVYLDATGNVSISESDINNGSTDACGIESVTIDSSNFDCAEVGMNSVILNVTDANGNTDTCSSIVTVLDTISPIASCQDITIYLDAAGMASITPNDINDGSSDACGIQSLSIDSSNFDCTEIGMNDVVLTVTDNNDNVSTCTAQVTVLDTISPIAVCQNVTVYLDAEGMATIQSSDVDNGSSDACGIKSLTIDSSNFDCSKVGMNIVTLTVTDNNDNVSTCISEVMVLDTIPPSVICQDITVYLDATGDVSISENDINNGSSDACGIESVIIDSSNFDCAEIGMNTIILTVTDVNRNADTCSSIVTVLDTISPTTICQDITIYLDENGMASITSEDIDNGSSDNCGIESLVIDSSDFDCTEVGLNTVVLAVTDQSGNQDTCQAVITVLDTISPTAICNSLSLELPVSGMLSVTTGQVDGGSSDACGIETISLSQSEFTCENIGENEVVMTVTDVNGNTSTCTALITITSTTETFDLDVVGPQRICDSLINLPYAVQFIEGAIYNWTFDGSGATIKNNGDHEIMLDVDAFVGGTLSVDMESVCGDELGSATFEIELGGDAFCELATCLREYAFISNEVLAINGSIDVYKVSNRIKSEAEIPSPRSLVFKAGETIEMDPPFSVGNGSVFVAEIEACANQIEALIQAIEK